MPALFVSIALAVLPLGSSVVSTDSAVCATSDHVALTVCDSEGVTDITIGDRTIHGVDSPDLSELVYGL